LAGVFFGKIIKDIEVDFDMTIKQKTDIMVYGWIGGKHVYLGLTGISPLVGFGVGNFTVG
jgi:hypothetical protein